MPYIPKETRPKINNRVAELALAVNTPEELSYAITKLILYCQLRIVEGKSAISYSWLSHVLGVLEATKLEIYRRMVAPYEEIKAGKNGDVFQEGDQ